MEIRKLLAVQTPQNCTQVMQGLFGCLVVCDSGLSVFVTPFCMSSGGAAERIISPQLYLSLACNLLMYFFEDVGGWAYVREQLVEPYASVCSAPEAVLIRLAESKK